MTTPVVEPWTTKRLLAWIAEAFTKKGLESSRLQAEMLVAHVVAGGAGARERMSLYTQHDRPATPLERATLRDLVGRALADEPIDYLIGERWFFGLPFHVSPAVLVPRPCTETIVEQVLLHAKAMFGALALKAAPGPGSPRIADVCTGSGCIVTALLKHMPAATALACDLSAPALETAARNARRAGVDDRVEFLEGDLLAPLFNHPSAPAAHDGAAIGAGALGGGFHYLVSNPPYIPDDEWESVPPNVRNYEPSLALRGGPDGLKFIRPLLDDGPRLLRPGGLLLIETAASTAERLVLMARAHALLATDTCRIVHDLDGLPRVVIAARAE